MRNIGLLHHESIAELLLLEACGLSLNTCLTSMIRAGTTQRVRLRQ